MSVVYEFGSIGNGTRSDPEQINELRRAVETLGLGANVVMVGENCEYETITEGLAAASSGDIVFVMPGDYAEEITVPSGVSLRGLDPLRTTVVGIHTADEAADYSAHGCILAGNNHVEGIGFYNESLRSSLLYISGSGCVVTGCRFRGGDAAIKVESAGTHYIHRNTFDGEAWVRITIAAATTTYVTGNTWHGVLTDDDDNGSVRIFLSVLAADSTTYVAHNILNVTAPTTTTKDIDYIRANIIGGTDAATIVSIRNYVKLTVDNAKTARGIYANGGDPAITSIDDYFSLTASGGGTTTAIQGNTQLSAQNSSVTVYGGNASSYSNIGNTSTHTRIIFAAPWSDMNRGTQTGSTRRSGTVALSSGTASVTTPACTTSSRIMVSYLGNLSNGGILTTVPGSGSFAINSSNASDASTVYWAIPEPV